MDGSRSREAAVSFLEYVAQKGLMAPATARARKAAVNTVLAILDEQEALDVTKIDLDDVMNRFSHLQGKDYTPDSLKTYKSRVRGGLDDFANYLQNPLAFRPSIHAREKKSVTPKSSVSATRAVADTPPAEMARPQWSSASGPMASSILPIPIRADLTVFIQGLPFNLTDAEAKKIAGVIQAMATPA